MTRYLIFLLMAAGLAQSMAYEERVLFSTGFEESEGYQSRTFLIGQQGWTGLGEDGNGIEFFEIYNQAALVGFWPPTDDLGQVSVWKPLNHDPGQSSFDYVRFSVVLEFVDSTNEKYDCFRWSAYNLKEEALFKLDFDNFTQEVSYSSDGGQTYEQLGFKFQPGGFYRLEMEMHLAGNLMKATLNDVPILNGAPITTLNVERTLGDIDAVWFIFDPENPGDNFMIFDDYTVVSGNYPSIPARLALNPTEDASVVSAVIYGDPNQVYFLETTRDFVVWNREAEIQTNDEGIAEYWMDSMEHDSVFFRVGTLP